MTAGHPDLVFAVLEEARLVISCQSRFNPSDEEWERWMSAAGNLERRAGSMRLLVVTEGGHPTKPQLEKLRGQNKSNPATAIVSPSLALRFLGSALTFVNPTIRCFSPANFEEAFEHIGVRVTDRLQARSTVTTLQQQLAASSFVDKSP